MSDLRRSAQALAEEVGDRARRLAGSLRKMAVDRTRAGIWKFLGYEFVTESREAEIYQGIGFHARPATGSKAEAIVAFVGGAGGPVAIALRDEQLRAAVDAVEAFAADESALFNTLAIVRVKADGTVEIRAVGGGPALPLATKADLDALADYVKFHIHASDGGGPTSLGAVPGAGVPAAAGTSVLRG